MSGLDWNNIYPILNPSTSEQLEAYLKPLNALSFVESKDRTQKLKAFAVLEAFIKKHTHRFINEKRACNISFEGIDLVWKYTSMCDDNFLNRLSIYQDQEAFYWKLEIHEEAHLDKYLPKFARINSLDQAGLKKLFRILMKEKRSFRGVSRESYGFVQFACWSQHPILYYTTQMTKEVKLHHIHLKLAL